MEKRNSQQIRHLELIWHLYEYRKKKKKFKINVSSCTDIKVWVIRTKPIHRNAWSLWLLSSFLAQNKRCWTPRAITEHTGFSGVFSGYEQNLLKKILFTLRG